MSDSVKMLEVIAGFFLLFFVVAIAMYIVLAIGLWRILEKAGKPGWHGLIPFLNLYDLAEVSGNNPILFLVVLIPGVGFLIYDILVSLGLAKNFGQSTGFGVLTIFFMPLMLCILGFGSFTYQGNLASGIPSNPGQSGAAQNPVSNDPWVNGQV